MIEREVQVEGKGGRLAGTLCLPAEEGVFPVVLMSHGSGPLDRDENMKGQKLEVFNAVAHRLAQSGVASVRFDKRGCGASQGDYYAAGLHDFFDDVVSCYDWLRRSEFCEPERLFLLGHSEGCLVVAQAALQRPETAGLVLLCPFVEPIEDVLMRQGRQIERELASAHGVTRFVYGVVTRLFGGPVENQEALIRTIRASTEASVSVRWQRVPAKWLRELLSVDAGEALGQLSCPLLLVGGEKDLQCDPADVARIAALAKGAVEEHIISDLTHLLRRDDQPATLLGSRRLLKQPVDPEVLELVAKWVAGRSAS